ncbi:ANTAR domain-containing protein [Streptomyces sp. NPDC005244]|uniref:ANTAR domain-containing protein n=1 Tax=Streptomyces sp. NPDC005244 TaxID=3364708 RepID=UPI003689A181
MTAQTGKPNGAGPHKQPQRGPEKVVALIDENAQLREAVHSHAVIDQAIGVLLAVGELTPDQGWNVLREVSQHTNIKLRHVSELLIDWARTGNLCTDIRTELERQLAAYTRTSRPSD